MNVKPTKKSKIIIPAKRLMARKSPEQMLDLLTTAIKDIYNQNASNLSYEELYRSAYNLVIAKKSELLYNTAKNKITELVAEKVLAFLGKNPVGALNLDTGLELLRKTRDLWALHTNSIRLIHDILIYLDNVYVKSARKLHIYDLGLLIFEEQVLLKPQSNFFDGIVKTILLIMQHERNGFTSDTVILKQIIEMTLETKTKAITALKPRSSSTSMSGNHTLSTKVATPLFEFYVKPEIISASQQFYKNEYSNMPEDLTLIGFFSMVKAKKADEKDRANRYLTEYLGQDIITIITNELLIPFNNEKLEGFKSELDPILVDSQLDAFKLIYSEAATVRAIEHKLLAMVSNHILSRCTTLLSEELSKSAEALSIANAKSQQAKAAIVATNWVESISKYYHHYSALARQPFVNNREFQSVVNESFAKVTAKNPSAAEHISLFIDDQIKRGFKGKSDKETDEILDMTIVLFRFLPDKDIFEMYMRQQLSKRLLASRSTGSNIEANFISKLKMECGPQYTQRLEGMLKDMQLSADLSKEFNEIPKDSDINNVQVFGSVLTYTYWPLSQISVSQIQEAEQSALILPPRVEQVGNQFSQFYRNKFSGRKFVWLNNMGTAEITARFKSSSYELVVSTVQMLILNLFNEAEDDYSLDYSDILARTGVKDAELIRNLQSLACTKYRLLIKTPMSRDINEGDTFKLNLNFAAPMKKYKVPMIVASSSASASKSGSRVGTGARAETGSVNGRGGNSGDLALSNNSAENHTNKSKNGSNTANSDGDLADFAKLEEERRYMIDAAIVRIMKSCKSIEHANLVAETIAQLKSRFQPSPLSIKLRIDSLIDRDYIERSSSDRKIYLYIA